MAFDSVSAFLVMEGHGPYVWTCYAVFFLLTGWLAAWSLRERRRVIRRQLHRMRLDADATAARPVSGGNFKRINSS